MSEKRALPDSHHGDAMARFIEGVNRRSDDVLRSAFSTNWIDHRPEGPRGYDSFEEAVKSVVRAFPDFMLSMDERIDAGDRVIVRLTMTGTHQGVFFSRPPSGKLIAVRSHDIHRLVDDRIVESWQLEDWFALLEQIGGIDPVPTPADADESREAASLQDISDLVSPLSTDAG